MLSGVTSGQFDVDPQASLCFRSTAAVMATSALAAVSTADITLHSVVSSGEGRRLLSSSSTNNCSFSTLITYDVMLSVSGGKHVASAAYSTAMSQISDSALFTSQLRAMASQLQSASLKSASVELLSISAAVVDFAPSSQPTSQPSTSPTSPSHQPTGEPSSQPSSEPTSKPSFSKVRSASSAVGAAAAAINASIYTSVGVVVSLLLIAVVGAVVYIRYYNDAAIKKKQALAALESLPVHRCIVNEKDNESKLLQMIETYPDTVNEVDFDGKTAFDLALNASCGSDVIFALLKISLPVDVTTHQPREATEHGYSWFKVIQRDEYGSVVDMVLEEFPKINSILADATDSLGRKAVDFASPRCKKILQQSTYLLKRFELSSLKPHHESLTCKILIAKDHENSGREVALKFMRNASQFQRGE